MSWEANRFTTLSMLVVVCYSVGIQFSRACRADCESEKIKFFGCTLHVFSCVVVMTVKLTKMATSQHHNWSKGVHICGFLSCSETL